MGRSVVALVARARGCLPWNAAAAFGCAHAGQYLGFAGVGPHRAGFG